MQVKLRLVIKESKDGNKLFAFLGATYNLQVHMNRSSLQRSPVKEKSTGVRRTTLIRKQYKMFNFNEPVCTFIA